MADCRIQETSIWTNAVRTNDIDKTGSAGFLTGLVFGALAGFGAMMMLAPQSGKKTRAQIGQESIKIHDRATDTYDDLVTLSRFDNRKILTGIQGIIQKQVVLAGVHMYKEQVEHTNLDEFSRCEERSLMRDTGKES